MVKFLVKEGGADVESMDSSHMTPLSWVAYKGHLKVVKYLVKEGGSNIELKNNKWGLTPLSHAAKNGHVEVVHLTRTNLSP